MPRLRTTEPTGDVKRKAGVRSTLSAVAIRSPMG